MKEGSEVGGPCHVGEGELDTWKEGLGRGREPGPGSWGGLR